MGFPNQPGTMAGLEIQQLTFQGYALFIVHDVTGFGIMGQFALIPEFSTLCAIIAMGMYRYF